jgi:hypothetical protein
MLYQELTSSVGSGGDVGGLHSQLRELIRQRATNTRLDRERSATGAAIIGGTGDPDMRRFLSDTLKNHVLVQFGAGAATCGTIVHNLLPEFYSQAGMADGTPITVENAATSTWGQQFVQDPEHVVV